MSERESEIAIDIAPVADTDNENDESIIFDGVYNSVIPLSDAVEERFTGQLLRSGWSWATSILLSFLAIRFLICEGSLE